MGMALPFSHSADFSGMSSRPLYLSAVKHKSFVEVNEEGTEAAAATVAVMRPMAMRPVAPPFEMVVDRPFLFVIADNLTRAILFMGVVFRAGERDGVEGRSKESTMDKWGVTSVGPRCLYKRESGPEKASAGRPKEDPTELLRISYGSPTDILRTNRPATPEQQAGMSMPARRTGPIVCDPSRDALALEAGLPVSAAAT